MTERFVGLGLELREHTSDPLVLARAVLRFYQAVGCQPTRMTYRKPRSRSYAFRATKLEQVVQDPEVPRLTLSGDSDDIPRVVMSLRFIPDPAVPLKKDFETRWFGVTMAASPVALPAELRALLEAVVSNAPVSQGCAAAFDDAHAASAECILESHPGGPGHPDLERLGEDQMLRRLRQVRLRRLYPLTIVGPQMWSALPPMPRFDPMPTVEDLGDCKLITAWPTLCGPRDPAFLRGTRALRAWLWPHTIQNPADHVDNDPPGDGVGS